VEVLLVVRRAEQGRGLLDGGPGIRSRSWSPRLAREAPTAVTRWRAARTPSPHISAAGQTPDYDALRAVL